MTDSQIVAAQVAPAPLVYQLPSAVEFVLKAVNADFDGSGSAAAWLPAVVIASDSGHVVAYALDQAVQVAAGGSAAVSWFPGVKHAGAGGSAALDLAWCFAEGNMRMDGTDLAYFAFDTPNPAVYDVTGFPNRIVRILEAGSYLVFISSLWTVNAGVPAIGTRVLLTYTVTYTGAGGSERDVLAAELSVGVNDSTGIAGHLAWQTNGVVLVNVPATAPPVEILLGALNTAASNVLSADTTLTVQRLSVTPFAGGL